MAQDRFTKVMLVIIAVLLAANFVRREPANSPFDWVATPAQAQLVRGTGEDQRRIDVRPVRGYSVNQMKDIIVLGDNKSFIVSNPNGFMVYQVDDFSR